MTRSHWAGRAGGRRWGDGRWGGAPGGGAFGGDALANPMEGAANLADAMLVLACGLMLALVINWDVDIARSPGEAAAALTEVEGVAEGGAAAEAQEAPAGLEELGVVYRDPSTGKLYMVANDG